MAVRLLSRVELSERLVTALDAAGYIVVAETTLGARPLLMSVRRRDETRRLRIFLWNCTPGGPPGVRAPDEWRVQTTRPGGIPFHVADGRETLLLGLHQAQDILIAWEVRAHTNPATSSSLQVALTKILEATTDGFVSQARTLTDGTPELVVAFQPALIETYLDSRSHLGMLMAAGDVDAAAGASDGDEVTPGELPDAAPRRRAVTTVSRLVRDARFRARVLRVYGGRCAFCGLGAGLAEAAHIQPVADEGPDVVANGVAACPTHHTAFDRGLIQIRGDGTLSVSSTRAQRLGIPSAQIGELAAGLLPRLRAARHGHAPAPQYLAHHSARWPG
jgi:hypothetical protein